MLGVEAIPQVRDAAADPYLAALSALAHGNRPGGLDVVLAALERRSENAPDSSRGQ